MPASFFSNRYADQLLLAQRPWFNTLEVGLFKNASIPAGPTVLANYTQPSNTDYGRQALVVTAAPAGFSGNRMLTAELTEFVYDDTEPQEIINGFFLYEPASALVVAVCLRTDDPQPYILAGDPFTILIRLGATFTTP